jgi:hypothetical protein
MLESKSALLLIVAGLVVGTFGTSPAVEAPAEYTPIGGRWYVKNDNRPRYYYRDGDRYVDLFSYHQRDSNKDGIDNVRLSHDANYLIMLSQGYPNHPTAVFPNSGNPNSIRVQNFEFWLPLVPQLAKTVTRVPMGPIGVALNGVVFFNPFEAGGMNAVEGYSEVWLDSCCGHPQQHGVYHYHKYPTCVKSPFSDDGKQHSPILGFAFDGFPIYGPYEESGVMARDLKGKRALDACNGHSDDERGYHYHVTPGRFPYIIGGYAGVPERSNSRELARAPSGAIQDNSQGNSRLETVIAGIRPNKLARGKKHSVKIELAPSHAGRRNALPAEKPRWVQFGPFETDSISRQGNIVTAEIEIPEEAAVGVSLDCHIEFASQAAEGGTLVFKKNDALRVTE